MPEIIVALVLLFALMGIGTPIHVALGLSGLAIFFANGLPATAAVHTIINGTNSFPLIAIPFFIFAGHLMNAAQVTDRIFNFAKAIVGWTPGGLGHVNIGSSVVFAGMSGAAVADAGGLGAIEIKAMKDAGYDKGFAVGVTAASSTIGPIIPPSLPLIIYGVIAEQSIGELFAAGIIPGMLMALSLMAMVAWYAKKRNYPKDAAFSLPRLLSSGKAAIFPMITPAIIVGGIISGVFTPTEAAVAAVAFTIFIGFVVYKTLTWTSLVHAAMNTIKTTASVLMIVSAAALFAWVLTANQVAEHLASGLLTLTDNKVLLLLMIMMIVFSIGFFMETIAAITIIVPLILPVASSVGIDPVHLGIIVILNLMIGLLTPPVGMVLYVLAKVADTPFEKCVKSTLPFLVPLLVVLLLLVFIPQLSLWLPSLLY
ncbi:TRAP transporter large permease [Pelagicoccus mobilis]|uniref:TRAP transporter large permease n=1 Tax=Pelagicoccus mobilis TaxID=415221 RepID=A0A934S6I1_9BACT|nr:TRAP transporter large permease [Pelagicoccus mobilis]MBK1880284.1 TRAP transporter large permease [Pelagicoccus mobilis]